MTFLSQKLIRRFLPLACVALLAIAVGNQAPAEQKPTTQSAAPQPRLTFNHDIAPILYRSCAHCHRPGEAGPFPLLTYSDAKSHARQIAAVTRSRFMPPWLPEETELKFADELRLSEDEIARIQAWVGQATAEGNPADLPATPNFVEGWQLDKPDIVVKATKAYELPASGSDNYWNFVFRAPVDRTRWLKAMEIRPGDKRLVHHANVLVDRQQTGRRQEAEPGAGFAGMELTIESEAFDPDSHFLFWKPGSIPYVEPDGMALRLDKDTDLILNTHLQPSGKPETIQPTLGLYFTDKPATMHPILLQLENDRMLDIPAGEKHFVITDEFTLPADVHVLAIYPHAHYLGKDLQAVAKLPDGRSETLIHIPDWNLNWQAVYRYARPVKLPKGTTISMKFVYDNSDNNVRNPNNPPQRVVAGNRAVDEMAHLWLQVLPEDSTQAKNDPRAEILEAMARHNLQKNPEDFEAHYNLAALLMGRGEVAEALAQFAQANRIRPNQPTVNNAFGAALLVAGRTEDSVTHLTAALNARPNYFDARYNLGNALASLGDFRGALAQFQAAVRINPEDANAEANLGSAFAEIGDIKQAKLHYERALRLNPNNELARENLQQLTDSSHNSPK
jgi:tetratricopeptide (TPR) repeat protein/mono/diheme cytochrome c family protein